jgi:hypothetical protein
MSQLQPFGDRGIVSRVEHTAARGLLCTPQPFTGTANAAVQTRDSVPCVTRSSAEPLGDTSAHPQLRLHTAAGATRAQQPHTLQASALRTRERAAKHGVRFRDYRTCIQAQVLGVALRGVGVACMAECFSAPA